MAGPLILPFTFYTLVTVHLVNANYCEGQYTTNLADVYNGISVDTPDNSYAHIIKKHVLNINKDLKWFHICDTLNLDQKLSICMKVLQHKLKKFRPISFTVDPTESDCRCREERFYGKKKQIYEQRMYTCPTTIVKCKRGDDESSDEEPPFLIGEGSHKTHPRVRFTDGTSHTDLPLIQGQLTGFEFEALNFERTPNEHYMYKPDYVDSDASGSSGKTGSGDDDTTKSGEHLLKESGNWQMIDQ